MLATQPTANVTLNLSSSNTSEGTVSPASLTFTPADWNVPQTVTVTGVNDNQPGSVPYQVVFAPAVSTDPNYSGLTAAPVSLTNLPGEVENIQVANLAVNPSTGLNQGSNLTITWNDTNTGNMPATAAWDDQVVITNTTTGDTLTTAEVLTDPNVDGPLTPGGVAGPAVRLHAAHRGRRHGQHPGHRHRERQPQRLRDGDQPGQCEPADVRQRRAITRPRRPP